MVVSRTFPGHYCPGLIEAMEAGAAGPASIEAFRGITAPASLKHADGDAAGHEAAPFRGITAPASLKPRRRRW